jgi:hypothetical protein
MIGTSGTTTIEVAGVEGVSITIVGIVEGILKTRSTHPCRITSLNGGCACTRIMTLF